MASLSGLYSYTTGNPVPIPKIVFVLGAIVGIISALAYYKYDINRRKLKKIGNSYFTLNNQSYHIDN